jgi:hypothetical protein
MRYRILIIIFVCFLPVIACNNNERFDPRGHFSSSGEKEFLLRLMPYVTKLPRGVSPEQRFDPGLRNFYSDEVMKYTLHSYFFSTRDSFAYFLITRPAPSLYEKRIAIGGRLKQDRKGNITGYEEIFWTFKMEPAELSAKAGKLFGEMVEGKSLEQYMPGKATGEWIEFPDGRIYFDKRSASWKTRVQETFP